MFLGSSYSVKDLVEQPSFLLLYLSCSFSLCHIRNFCFAEAPSFGNDLSTWEMRPLLLGHNQRPRLGELNFRMFPWDGEGPGPGAHVCSSETSLQGLLLAIFLLGSHGPVCVLNSVPLSILLLRTPEGFNLELSSQTHFAFFCSRHIMASVKSSHAPYL